MMTMFKAYTSIKGYLERFTIFKVSNVHLRLHTIKRNDATTLFHNHPFKYVSIVYRGGYTEQYIDQTGKVQQRTRLAPCIIYSNQHRQHRIEKLHGETKTLFLALGKYTWYAQNTVDHSALDGVFMEQVGDIVCWSKRKNGIWYIRRATKELAEQETRHSIFQDRTVKMP